MIGNVILAAFFLIFRVELFSISIYTNETSEDHCFFPFPRNNRSTGIGWDMSALYLYYVPCGNFILILNDFSLYFIDVEFFIFLSILSMFTCLVVFSFITEHVWNGRMHF